VNITPVSSFTVENGYNGKQGQVKIDNVSTGAESYYWDFGNGKSSTEENPVALFTEDGTYIIKLVSLNQFNCSDTTFYKYELLFKGLYVPNAFAPTSTNLGVRLFQPVGINLKQYHVTVFDNWGHLMWESTKLDDKGMPTEGWDGTFEGNAMPQGNYMWRISALFVDDSPWEGSDIGVGDSNKTMGTVTLIK
jgi:gliding motility-associated-like protein